MRTSPSILVAAALIGAIVPAPRLAASLTTLVEVEGRIGWSLDGADAGSALVVVVPPGSAVERAFLYTSEALHTEQPPQVTPTVDLAGVVYDSSHFTPLPFVSFPPPFLTGMQAFRADATAQVSQLIGSGSELPFQLPILDHDFPPRPVPSPPGSLMLAVIYRNPGEPWRRIVLMDGAVAPAGDTFTFDLTEPTLPGPALLSLGIGFSSGAGVQKTLVDIDGRRLTSIAGGHDEVNVGLTVGGFQDSPSNPADPFASPLAAGRLDDELYDLSLGNDADPSPFVSAGSTAIVVATSNPSLDDNLFFAAINVAQAAPSVLEIPTLSARAALLLVLLLMGAGLATLARRH